jgi:hypothetical protein
MELLIFFLGVVIGWLCYRQALIMVSRAMLEKYIQPDHHEIQSIECVLEKYQDQYFLYQCPDMKFLAQGTSIDTIKETLNQRFQHPVLIKIKENHNENSISQ